MILFYLTSAIFLGWTLGANAAGNVFGTAVATRMVRFRTASAICAIFVIAGAVLSGAGASATLGDLGAVNALGGSFMVALAAGVSVLWMTKAGLPVSVSQAIVGGIIGWNLFTGSETDRGSLVEIISTWVVCPLLSGGIAAILFVAARRFFERREIHMLERDTLVRVGFLLAGGFGAYALGANNVANVVGVFVPAVPAGSVRLLGIVPFSHAQGLFLIGGAAIAVGVATYSRRVMMTVGKELFGLSPVTGLIVVVAQGIVLLLFASVTLRDWLVTHGIPPIPLVPISSSQTVIGAVVGIALVKGGRNIKYGVLARIAGGWAATPFIAAVVSFFGLFILQNVFTLPVARSIPYELTQPAFERVIREGLPAEKIEPLLGVRFKNARDFKSALRRDALLDAQEVSVAERAAEIHFYEVDPGKIARLDLTLLTHGQIAAIRSLSWKSYTHRWQLRDALAAASSEWAFLPAGGANYIKNRDLETRLRYVEAAFRIEGTGAAPSEVEPSRR